jgi:hypothetical protein
MSSSTFCLLRSFAAVLWSTTARLIGDVRVSVLKMFHPPSDTAGTHVGDSHSLRAHDGNVGGAHALILHSSWRGKMSLIVL